MPSIILVGLFNGIPLLRWFLSWSNPLLIFIKGSICAISISSFSELYNLEELLWKEIILNLCLRFWTRSSDSYNYFSILSI